MRVPITRVLVLSNRDTSPGPDDPPLGALLTRTASAPVAVDENSVALVACDIVESLSRAHGIRVFHRSALTPSDVLAAIGDHQPDVVFNLCESLRGDSRLEVAAAWLMDRLGTAYTGSPYSALRHCLFKSECSALLERAGVPIPQTYCATTPDHLPEFKYPLIVKPEREDGSAGIGQNSVVHDAKRLREQVAEVVETCKQPAVIQQYIEGREIAVSVLGWPTTRVLPLGEITFHDLPEGHPHILTYASKWLSETVDSIGTPSVAAVLPPRDVRRIGSVGRRAFDVLGLRDYGRVDVRFAKDGVPYVIDVNPNCDLSRDGGFAKAAGRAHLSYDALVWEITRCALRRKSEGRVPVVLGRRTLLDLQSHASMA